MNGVNSALAFFVVWWSEVRWRANAAYIYLCIHLAMMYQLCQRIWSVHWSGLISCATRRNWLDWTGLDWSGLVWSPWDGIWFFLSVIIILLWAFSKRDCCTGGQSREESLSVVRGVGFWEGISKCDWLMIEISGLESECVPWYLCATYSTTIQGWLESSEWMKRNFNTTIVVSVVPRTQAYHPRHTYHARIHSQRVEHWRCIETC